jgi:hypothetical protein
MIVPFRLVILLLAFRAAKASLAMLFTLMNVAVDQSLTVDNEKVPYPEAWAQWSRTKGLG